MNADDIRDYLDILREREELGFSGLEQPADSTKGQCRRCKRPTDFRSPLCYDCELQEDK